MGLPWAWPSVLSHSYGTMRLTLPTRYSLARPEIGEEFHVELEQVKVLILKLLAIGPFSEQTGQREVFYKVNSEVRQVSVVDQKASIDNIARPKADAADSSQVAAPMSIVVVVEIRVHDDHKVKRGVPVAVLSAMKMVSEINLLLIPFRIDSLTELYRKWSSSPLTAVRSNLYKSRRATLSTARILSANWQSLSTSAL